MRGRSARTDRGSLTVELVVITPVLFLLAVMMVAFGRVSSCRQAIEESARAGAETAAIQPTSSAAVSSAAVAAAVGTSLGTRYCTHLRVTTDVGRFQPGGMVVVTVACQVGLSDLAIPGMPGETTVSESATAPIDPFREVS
jgi:Flp pilus assembly protein TadG